MDFTIDLFWTEYTYFDKNYGPFYGGEFIWKIKYIRDDKSFAASKMSTSLRQGYWFCRMYS